MKSLTLALGKGKPFRLCLSCILLCITTLIYFFTLASFVKPVIYPLIDRVVYTTRFDDIYFLNSFFDHIIVITGTLIWLIINSSNKTLRMISISYAIFMGLSFFSANSHLTELLAVLSLPLVGSILVVNRGSKLFFDYRLYLTYLCIPIVFLSIIGNIILFEDIAKYSIITLVFKNYLYYLFLLFSLSTPLLIYFLTAYAIYRLGRLLISKSNLTIHPINKANIASYQKENNKHGYLILSGIIIFSLILTLIPHSSFINIDSQPVGDDSADYRNILIKLQASQSISEFINNSFFVLLGGDRPIALIAFLAFAEFIDKYNLINGVEMLPLLISPFLVITTFLLTKEITSNMTTSLYASFITAISFQTMIGVYGGLYANWLSLSFAYIMLLFLIRYLNGGNKLDYGLFTIFSILLFFTHTPSWTIFLLVIGIFLAVLLVKTYDYKRILALVIACLPTFIIDIVKWSLLGNSGIVSDIAFTKTQSFGFDQIYLSWLNVIDTSHIYLGGIFSNFLVFSLIIYYFKVIKSTNYWSILFLIFLSLFSIPLLFGDSAIQSRMLYEIPFQIPAAIAISSLSHASNKWISFTILVWMSSISFRTITNFYYSPILQ